ncbi:hypothetical protein [Rhizobium mongolense]|uniref:hypothetical protein n=1 Tax=Rhizobium mongolense TaxID=57676 RepID=UPI0034A31750
MTTGLQVAAPSGWISFLAKPMRTACRVEAHDAEDWGISDFAVSRRRPFRTTC